MGDARFQAGLEQPQTYAVRMNLYLAGFNETRGVLLARFVEFWCQKNCFGDWHVDQTQAALAVSFSLETDCVLFMISEEYTYFVPSATTRPRPYAVQNLSAFITHPGRAGQSAPPAA